MVDTQFCLEWDSHNRNICSGLSSLQQNGEFVDMTLAADGHHVKVHQMILSLASPYIKELVTSANCPHPIIFLNKVSYKTLCSILEYVYTGQTQVAVDEISELITAARELHIKGLEDVKSVGGLPSTSDTEIKADEPVEMPPEIQIKLQRPDISTPTISKSLLKRKLDIGVLQKIPSNMPLRKRTILNTDTGTPEISKDPDLVKDDSDANKDFGFDDPLDVDDRVDDDDDNNEDNYSITTKKVEENSATSVQYTVSNQGSLQLVLNRFMYFLYYQYRDKSRQWRCVDNRKIKCMASVFTKNNMVIRRVGAHNHTFHDKNILKKVRAGAIYSALQEAEAKTTKQPRMTHPNDK